MFQFINHANKTAGGAQTIAHQIHSVFAGSEIFGFDFVYSQGKKTLSNVPLCFLNYVYCAIFQRQSIIIIHHRIFLILNLFLRHKNSYFICHNIFPSKNFIFKVNTCMRYVAVSDEVFSYLSAHCPESAICTIYNGLDVDEASYREGGADQFTICYVGRLSQQKGVRDLVEAFKIFSEGKSDVFLRIIGDGECLDELLECAAGSFNIEFCGKKDKPFRECVDASVVVVPSRYEGFGLVYYEALEYGHYVLASSLSVFETLSGEEHVKFFEPGDLQGMCCALEYVYGSVLIDATIKKRRHRFSSMEIMNDQHRTLFEEEYD